MKKIISLVLIPLLGSILLSCGSEISTINNLDGLKLADIAARGQIPDKTGKMPGLVYSDVKSLISEVRSMSAGEIDALEEDRLFYMAAPLIELRYGTVKLPERAVKLLADPMQRLSDHTESGSVNGAEIRDLKSEMNKLLQNYLSDIELRRSLTTEEIKAIFGEWNRGEGYELTCSSFYNNNEAGIFLIPGDNLRAAHTFCEEMSLFLLSEGSYYRQSVEQVRSETAWIGIGHVRLDGLNAVEAAFNAGMAQSYFGWFEIANYTGYGIKSTADEGVSDISIQRLWFNQIGRDADGQKYGAVKFEWASNISITESKFENVTSSIRFLNSKGPLIVADNEALNTGRNFFQCDKCRGKEIRIENNKMEQYGQSGTKKLEDFINIYKSYGTAENYIQIRGNRARTDGTGNGVSSTGSFIILGDHGGEYQIAEGNIGVNPGNVGVGMAGGSHILMIDNVMYSDPIEGISNVAFYSYAEPASPEIPCFNHASVGNRAYWYCFSKSCTKEQGYFLNNAYSPNFESLPEYCGLTNFEINQDMSVFEDSTLTPAIWDDL